MNELLYQKLCMGQEREIAILRKELECKDQIIAEQEEYIKEQTRLLDRLLHTSKEMIAFMKDE